MSQFVYSGNSLNKDAAQYYGSILATADILLDNLTANLMDARRGVRFSKENPSSVMLELTNVNQMDLKKHFGFNDILIKHNIRVSENERLAYNGKVPVLVIKDNGPGLNGSLHEHQKTSDFQKFAFEDGMSTKSDVLVGRKGLGKLSYLKASKCGLNFFNTRRKEDDRQFFIGRHIQTADTGYMTGFYMSNQSNDRFVSGDEADALATMLGIQRSFGDHGLSIAIIDPVQSLNFDALKAAVTRMALYVEKYNIHYVLKSEEKTFLLNKNNLDSHRVDNDVFEQIDLMRRQLADRSSGNMVHAFGDSLRDARLDSQMKEQFNNCMKDLEAITICLPCSIQTQDKTETFKGRIISTIKSSENKTALFCRDGKSIWSKTNSSFSVYSVVERTRLGDPIPMFIGDIENAKNTGWDLKTDHPSYMMHPEEFALMSDIPACISNLLNEQPISAPFVSLESESAKLSAINDPNSYFEITTYEDILFVRLSSAGMLQALRHGIPAFNMIVGYRKPEDGSLPKKNALILKNRIHLSGAKYELVGGGYEMAFDTLRDPGFTLIVKTMDINKIPTVRIDHPASERKINKPQATKGKGAKYVKSNRNLKGLKISVQSLVDSVIG